MAEPADDIGVSGRHRKARTTATGDRRTVVLAEAPIEVLIRSTEHQAELVREFTLLLMRSERSTPGAASLATLVRELQRHDPEAEAMAWRQQEAALARGETTVTLTVDVPASTAHDALRLRDALDCADALCRSGDLLTLAPPTDIVALRRWYLEEFDRQISGHKPLPWPHYAAQHGLA